MWNALKQLPRRLMVMLIISFVWSWMEPPFFAYGGYIFGRSRLLAIGVFASYYVIVIALLVLVVREVANLTGISFKSLFKQAFKGVGTRGLDGVGPQPAPVAIRTESAGVENYGQVIELLIDIDATLSGNLGDTEGETKSMVDFRNHTQILLHLLGLEKEWGEWLGLDLKRGSYQEIYEEWKGESK